MTQANLLTQLRAEPVADQRIAVLSPLAPELAVLPIAEEWKDDGIPLALLEAIAALSSGTRVREALSLDAKNLRWYLAWNGREGGEWGGELDAEACTFRCDAPADEARFGFACAAICLAWSRPSQGFDGQWAALLGTLAIEGVSAYRPDRVQTIACTVLHVLEGEGKPWELDASTAEHPESSDKGTQALVARLGGALLPRVLADFGLFSAAVHLWDRIAGSLRLFAEPAPAWAPITKALAAGLHVVVSGPSRVGKTTVIRNAFREFHKAEAAHFVEFRADTPEQLDELLSVRDEDNGRDPGALLRAIPDDDGCDDESDDADEREPVRKPVRTIIYLRLRAEPIGRASAALIALLDGNFRDLRDVLGLDFLDSVDELQLVIEVPDGCLRGASHAAYVRIDAPRAEDVVAPNSREDLGWLSNELRRCADTESIERAAYPEELRACERLAWHLIRAGRECRAAFREAAELTLVDRIGKLRPIWAQMSARWDAELRRQDIDGPNAAAGKARASGRDVWCDLQEVRTTVDWFASHVAGGVFLVLEPRVTEEGGMHVWYSWEQGSCHARVSTDVWMAESAPEALALTVLFAATAFGHRRWTPPVPDFAPAENASPEERRRADRRLRLHKLLEQARVEALVDGVWPEVLGQYRRRGAAVRLRHGPFYPAAPPGSLEWFSDLITEDMYAATGGGLSMDDAPCPVRRGAPVELGWQVSRVLAQRAAAAALGENAAGLSGVVMELEAILDGAC